MQHISWSIVSLPRTGKATWNMEEMAEKQQWNIENKDRGRRFVSRVYLHPDEQ